MAKKDTSRLTLREIQIMDIVYELQKVCVADVRERLPNPPSYSAVRAMLTNLEAKGHLRHRSDGPRYIYSAVMPRDAAQERAVRRLLRVFFDNSPAKAANALLSSSDSLSDDEVAELLDAIEEAKKRGR